MIITNSVISNNQFYMCICFITHFGINERIWPARPSLTVTEFNFFFNFSILLLGSNWSKRWKWLWLFCVKVFLVTLSKVIFIFFADLMEFLHHLSLCLSPSLSLCLFSMSIYPSVGLFSVQKDMILLFVSVLLIFWD